MNSFSLAMPFMHSSSKLCNFSIWSSLRNNSKNRIFLRHTLNANSIYFILFIYFFVKGRTQRKIEKSDFIAISCDGLCHYCAIGITKALMLGQSVRRSTRLITSAQWEFFWETTAVAIAHILHHHVHMVEYGEGRRQKGSALVFDHLSITLEQPDLVRNLARGVIYVAEKRIHSTLFSNVSMNI